MDYPRLYIPASSIAPLKQWIAESLQSIEEVSTTFDPESIKAVCALARRAEARFIACNDYELNALFSTQHSHPLAPVVRPEDAIQAPLSVLAHMCSEDTEVLMLFAAQMLFYGDGGFLRAMELRLRHSIDAVHWAIVGCEFIEKVSGANYLAELDDRCPHIVLPATIERFVASVEKLPPGPRSYTAKYLQLPQDERRATSPWAMMRAELSGQ